METKELLMPEVAKMSGLITAVSEYAIRSAREQWAQSMSSFYRVPRMVSWDRCVWLELVKDWEVVNYILSDDPRARKLMRTLHFCSQWYGQGEIDRLQSMGVGE
jgi:hypothetical protein